MLSTKLFDPTFDSFGNNKMIKKHFYCGKERAPFKPPIKVICILPVVCCNSETRVSRPTFAANPENYTGERNVVNDDDNDGKVRVHSAYNAP